MTIKEKSQSGQVNNNNLTNFENDLLSCLAEVYELNILNCKSFDIALDCFKIKHNNFYNQFKGGILFKDFMQSFKYFYYSIVDKSNSTFWNTVNNYNFK